MATEKKTRRPRRSFTDEFKQGAVTLVLDEKKGIAETARNLDLSESLLRSWVKQAEANRSGGKTGLTTEERAELARLRRENKVLKMERDILKKAAVDSSGRCNRCYKWALRRCVDGATWTSRVDGTTEEAALGQMAAGPVPERDRSVAG